MSTAAKLTNPTPKQISNYAYLLWQAGLMPIPISANGKKAAMAKYGVYRNGDEKYTEEVFERLWPAKGRRAGIAVLTCGAVSRLVGIDIDDPTVVDEFEAALPADLLARLVITASPSENYTRRHYYYLAPKPIGGKGALASHLVENKDGEPKPKARIETTNYCIIPGGDHGTHPLGKPYKPIKGSLLKVPEFTADEHETIFATASSFCTLPDTAPAERRFAENKKTPNIIASVGDDYNANATWEDILKPHGFEFVQQLGHRWLVRRPGKKEGHSLTVGDTSESGNSLLLNFSSSTVFDTVKKDKDGKIIAGSYTKFGAYTLLNHKSLDDDAFDKSVKDLANKGYGPEPLTDLGMAERAFVHNDSDLLICPDWTKKKWLRWDGTRYTREHGWVADELVANTIRALPHENPDNEAYQEYAKKTLSDSKISGIVRRLSKLRDMQVCEDDLDQNEWLFNMENGTYHMRTGHFREHRKREKLTKVAPFRFDPDAECPRFMNFLREVTKDAEGRERPDFIEYFAQFMAVTCLGVVKDHFFIVLYGDGGNGKGTFIATMERLMGTDYSHTVQADVLLSKKNTPHPTQLKQFRGKRFTPIQEFDAKQKLDEALIKGLTGGDTMNARGMHEDFLNFRPSHTIWLATNHMPHVDDVTEGFWRRLKLVPFDQKIDPDIVDDLKGHFDEELPGIFNFVLRGLKSWKAAGKLEDPADVAQAVWDLRKVKDPFEKFIARYTVKEENGDVPMRELYKLYESYCGISRQTPMKFVQFGNAIERRGHGTRVRTNKARVYRGLRLSTEEERDAVLDAGEI